MPGHIAAFGGLERIVKEAEKKGLVFFIQGIRKGIDHASMKKIHAVSFEDDHFAFIRTVLFLVPGAFELFGSRTFLAGPNKRQQKEQ